MPRKGVRRTSRLRSGSAKRRVGPKGRARQPQPLDVPIIVGGQKLNRWEARVWKALLRRNEDWQAQAQIGGRNILGSAKPDFLSERRKIVIEVDGPFHNTIEGRAREFFREADRKNAGYDTLHIEQQDLAQIDSSLRRLLGY